MSRKNIGDIGHIGSISRSKSNVTNTSTTSMKMEPNGRNGSVHNAAAAAAPALPADEDEDIVVDEGVTTTDNLDPELHHTVSFTPNRLVSMKRTASTTDQATKVTPPAKESAQQSQQRITPTKSTSSDRMANPVEDELQHSRPANEEVDDYEDGDVATFDREQPVSSSAQSGGVSVAAPSSEAGAGAGKLDMNSPSVHHVHPFYEMEKRNLERHERSQKQKEGVHVPAPADALYSTKKAADAEVEEPESSTKLRGAELLTGDVEVQQGQRRASDTTTPAAVSASAVTPQPEKVEDDEEEVNYEGYTGDPIVRMRLIRGECYVAGEMIHGSIEVIVPQHHQVNAVGVQLLGEEKLFIDQLVHENNPSRDMMASSLTDDYELQQVVSNICCNVPVTLFRAEDSGNPLPAGKHSFQFTILLRASLPRSAVFTNGYIRYQLIGFAHMFETGDSITTSLEVSVFENTAPAKEYCEKLPKRNVQGGLPNFIIQCSFDQKYYFTGDVARLHLEIVNHASSSVDYISVQLQQHIININTSSAFLVDEFQYQDTQVPVGQRLRTVLNVPVAVPLPSITRSSFVEIRYIMEIICHLKDGQQVHLSSQQLILDSDEEVDARTFPTETMTVTAVPYHHKDMVNLPEQRPYSAVDAHSPSTSPLTQTQTRPKTAAASLGMPQTPPNLLPEPTDVEVKQSQSPNKLPRQGFSGKSGAYTAPVSAMHSRPSSARKELLASYRQDTVSSPAAPQQQQGLNPSRPLSASKQYSMEDRPTSNTSSATKVDQRQVVYMPVILPEQGGTPQAMRSVLVQDAHHPYLQGASNPAFHPSMATGSAGPYSFITPSPQPSRMSSPFGLSSQNQPSSSSTGGASSLFGPRGAAARGYTGGSSHVSDDDFAAVVKQMKINVHELDVQQLQYLCTASQQSSRRYLIATSGGIEKMMSFLTTLEQKEDSEKLAQEELQRIRLALLLLSELTFEEGAEEIVYQNGSIFPIAKRLEFDDVDARKFAVHTLRNVCIHPKCMSDLLAVGGIPWLVQIAEQYPEDVSFQRDICKIFRNAVTSSDTGVQELLEDEYGGVLVVLNGLLLNDREVLTHCMRVLVVMARTEVARAAVLECCQKTEDNNPPYMEHLGGWLATLSDFFGRLTVDLETKPDDEEKQHSYHQTHEVLRNVLGTIMSLSGVQLGAELCRPCTHSLLKTLALVPDPQLKRYAAISVKYISAYGVDEIDMLIEEPAVMVLLDVITNSDDMQLYKHVLRIFEYLTLNKTMCQMFTGMRDSLIHVVIPLKTAANVEVRQSAQHLVEFLDLLT